MTILDCFGARLQELITEDGNSCKYIASSAGINVHYLYAYTSSSNTSMPTVDNLVRLANYFGCSLQYVVGLTDNNSACAYNRQLPEFGVRFRQVVEECGYNLYRLATKTNTSTTTYYRWINNKAQPNIESLYKVATTIDVSLDYLIGRER